MCEQVLSRHTKMRRGEVRMSEMISVASGFQYSVNIAYDLNSDDKLRNFIPTKSAMGLLEDVLLSTNLTSTNRSRVLIGAYGKGKSHIVLTILSILMRKDLVLFKKMLPKVRENSQLYQLLLNYYDSDTKILPVIITGSNTSLPQAFLLALQRTLDENNLIDVMPDTNYKAAITTIKRWEKDFPDTYKNFCNSIDVSVESFICELEEYNIGTYEHFERIYPNLTSGSVFNPFVGFDIVDLYESVVEAIKSRGYSGVFVVYDEFSKFLEANITAASVSDTKMLQDFAEKCNRSGEKQMHLMLISHKEIANYIDKLPKQKVDGWRGVSERFVHIHMNNNFTQTYEIIASVIQKDNGRWKSFCEENNAGFENLKATYANHAIFSDVSEEDLDRMSRDCYPLHLVSTFILPRLSERVAQNERTLFTFLSAEGKSTLPAFLKKYKDETFDVITPDQIYDYFEPLLKKEVYSGDLHKNYILTSKILEKLEPESLESKIIKVLGLIYILEQFEKLKPTIGEIADMFKTSYMVDDIKDAIENLIEKKYVIYLKRSNDYLRLKQTSGVDINEKINDLVVIQQRSVTLKETLNSANFDNFIYPYRYNDDKEMIRYFSFEFIESSEVTDDIDWNVKSEEVDADGIIYGIIPKDEDDVSRLKKIILNLNKDYLRMIFIIPKHYTEIESIVRVFNAVVTLRDLSVEDKILFEEYDVIYEDLREVINKFINTYTHPEEMKSSYIYQGELLSITRKTALTSQISSICNKIFSDTPIINNEALNKSEPTVAAVNSRNKITTALLRTELEPNLGLVGTAQEVSIMRNTLVRTGILVEDKGMMHINMQPKDELISNMLAKIDNFVLKAKREGSVNFGEIYKVLSSPEDHIGLRRGLIPLYLAVVFHTYKQEIIIHDRFGQISLITDSLLLINANPEGYTLYFLDWNPEKEQYIEGLSKVFGDFIIPAEKSASSYEYVVSAIRRWFMSLPKYTKEINASTSKRYASFLKTLKRNVGSNELLFKSLPKAFDLEEVYSGVVEEIASAKRYYDNLLSVLKKELIKDVKMLFVSLENRENLKKMSLASVINDWCDTLQQGVFEQIFSDSTGRMLGLFQAVTNDEYTFIERLAKLATDLRLEDWDKDTRSKFNENIKSYKDTSEEYCFKEVNSIDKSDLTGFLVSFVDEKNGTVTKRFAPVEISTRGKQLYKSLFATLDGMGQSITEQEKRQVLMDLLKKLL